MKLLYRIFKELPIPVNHINCSKKEFNKMVYDIDSNLSKMLVGSCESIHIKDLNICIDDSKTSCNRIFIIKINNNVILKLDALKDENYFAIRYIIITYKIINYYNGIDYYFNCTNLIKLIEKTYYIIIYYIINNFHFKWCD